jgi:putative ABC transport system ATP-binding protein
VTLLALADCAKARGGGFAVEATLALAAGEAVALTGPSGSGKSTLLLLMGAALPPDRGAVTLAGADVVALWRRADRAALARLRAARIGFVPQTGGLIPFLDVAGNVLLPQRLACRADECFARALAEELGIAALWGRMPAELSVGERQRVAIARALAHRPNLVLADEPTASVHPSMADTVLALLLREARGAGAALVLATHDVARARAAGLAEIACEFAPGRSRFARAVPA